MKKNFPKLLTSAALAASMLSMLPAVQAAQVTSTVNVTVNLTSACQISAAPGTITFNYAAFQGTAATGSTTVGVQCTDTLPYNLSFTADPVVTSSTPGTLVGLNYTLSVPVGAQAGSSVGNTHTISGSMAAGQAGTCGLATCTGNATHTLYVIY